MAFWWVSQGKTFSHERAQGYLWAPLRDRGGRTPFHWRTMNEVREGDTIFSYVARAFPALSVARGSAYPYPNPFPTADWDHDGMRIDVEYVDLDSPLALSAVMPSLQPLLPDGRSPIMTNGNGFTGYLFALPVSAGRLLLERATANVAYDLQEAALLRSTTVTQREALVQTRVGQGPFRDALLRRWGDRCCITGLAIPRLLRASHIKPWRDCNNEERLDCMNGLLLSASYDAAFDAGFITFEDDGSIQLGRALAASASSAGIDPNCGISGLEPERRRYLEYHRQNVFQG